MTRNVSSPAAIKAVRLRRNTVDIRASPKRPTSSTINAAITENTSAIPNLNKCLTRSLKKLQKKIFESAYNCLKSGGEIVYSTCTFSKNENTNNIQYFLEKYEDLEILEVEIPENIDNIRDEFGGIYISYKNKYLDGFYIAKLRKK